MNWIRLKCFLLHEINAISYCKMFLHQCHHYNLWHDSIDTKIHIRFFTKCWTHAFHRSINTSCIIALKLCIWTSSWCYECKLEIFLSRYLRKQQHTTILFISIISTIIVTITSPCTRYTPISTIKLRLRTSWISYEHTHKLFPTFSRPPKLTAIAFIGSISTIINSITTPCCWNTTTACFTSPFIDTTRV